MKILAFTNGSDSKWWRLESPARLINKKTRHQVVVKDKWGWFDCLKDSSYRVLVGQTFISPKMVTFLQARKIKVIYELDDAISDYDEKRVVLSKVFRNLSKVDLFETIKRCDAVTVTTKNIKKQVRQFYTGPIYILPNYIDLDWWGKPPRKSRGKKVKIGWFGSTSHWEDLERILKPAIEEVLSKFKNAVFFTHSFSKEIFKNIDKKRITFIDPCRIDEWKKFLKQSNWDIAVSPLIKDTFNSCKSPIKYFEFSAIKAPGVYSPTAYKGVVKHQKTGFIANSLDEWVKYLSLLIENQELRLKMGEQAYLDVKKKYQIKNHYLEWIRVFEKTARQ